MGGELAEAAAPNLESRCNFLELPPRGENRFVIDKDPRNPVDPANAFFFREFTPGAAYAVLDRIRSLSLICC